MQKVTIELDEETIKLLEDVGPVSMGGGYTMGFLGFALRDAYYAAKEKESVDSAKVCE